VANKTYSVAGLQGVLLKAGGAGVFLQDAVHLMKAVVAGVILQDASLQEAA
jgi:hypothetical protein